MSLWHSFALCIRSNNVKIIMMMTIDDDDDGCQDATKIDCHMEIRIIVIILMRWERCKTPMSFMSVSVCDMFCFAVFIMSLKWR